MRGRSSRDTRADARACFDAAIAAVEPEALTRSFLEERGAPAAAGEVHLAAIGKAAAAMARGAARVLGDRLASGIVIVPDGQTDDVPDHFEVYGGGHPIPNREGAEGARAIRQLAEGLGEGDELLCLISGGGSALMTLPPDGIDLEALQTTTNALLRAGATIGELNSVRKHLDQLKGGRLARAAYPARVVAPVLSDVIGDPLDVIASGPVSGDPTTFADAIEILERRDSWKNTPSSVRDYLTRGRDGDEAESPPPGDPHLEGAEAHIIGSNRMAADAALAKARELGYATQLLTTSLSGEAKEVGQVLTSIGREIRASGNPITAPACLAAAGETTVTVTGGGRGGRNQEVALGAALALAETPGVLVASLGTDGIDGPTDAAGAWADSETVPRAAELGLDASRYLADNDAYAFFKALDDLIITGPTGTNVMDIALVLVPAPATARLTTEHDVGKVESRPVVRSLRGSLRGIEVGENDYRRYLEDKHL